VLPYVPNDSTLMKVGVAGWETCYYWEDEGWIEDGTGGPARMT